MTSGVRLTSIAILVLLIVCQRASARSLLQSTSLFVPAGLDSCTIYVPSGCTLNTEATPRADACSQNNSDQLTSVVTAADNDQVLLYPFALSYCDKVDHRCYSLQHERPCAEVRELQGVKIAFYGDSITKLWRDRDGHGQSAIYKQYFGNYSAAVLGVGGEVSTCLCSRQRYYFWCYHGQSATMTQVIRQAISGGGFCMDRSSLSMHLKFRLC